MSVLPRLAAALLALALPLSAAAAGPDRAVARMLDQLGHAYEVDEDGDFRLVLGLEDERSQVVIVRSPVETFGSLRVREVWSPAWSAAGAFPVAVANRLLEASAGQKLGGWVRQGDYAVLVIQLPADAGAQALDDVIAYAAAAADLMELELGDGSDDY